MLCVEAMINWGWDISHVNPESATDQARQLSLSVSMDADGKYNPQPFDFSNIALTKELQSLAERLAECLCESRSSHERDNEEQDEGSIISLRRN